MSEMLSVHEAAAYLGITEATVRRLARQQQLPCIKVGRLWRFKKTVLDEWSAGNLELEEQETHLSSSDQTPIRLLLVDDEEFVYEVIRDMTESIGCEVTWADDGQKALDIVAKEEPDLVFMDLKMPHMDGPTALRKIREFYPDLPVVIFTAYPDSNMMQAAMAHTPIMLLEKPSSQERVLSCITQVLGMRKNSGSS